MGEHGERSWVHTHYQSLPPHLLNVQPLHLASFNLKESAPQKTLPSSLLPPQPQPLELKTNQSES